jgi:predicted DNA-binding transcriptional regulator AlpA
MNEPAQVMAYAAGTHLDDELLTDFEQARDLNVGLTKFFEIQKQPDFPAPIWLGPRLKRHRRRLVRQWALARTTKPVEAA